jgi:uncharacterized protein YjdB
MKKIFFLMLTLLIVSAASMNAQVTIGSTEDPHSGAVLDLQSTTLGMKLPQVSIANFLIFGLPLKGTSTAADAKGMVVYNTNSALGEGLYVWNGTQWKNLNSSLPGGEPEVAIPVTDFEILPAITNVAVGWTTTLVAGNFVPSNVSARSVTWSITEGSEYVSINVDQGCPSYCHVTGIGSGQAQITATCIDQNHATVSCTVSTVFEPIDLTEFSIDCSISGTITVGVDETIDIGAFGFLPVDATYKRVSWLPAEGYETYASVTVDSDNPNTCSITGIQTGSFNIQIDSYDGKVSYTYTVNIQSAPVYSFVTGKNGNYRTYTYPEGLGTWMIDNSKEGNPDFTTYYGHEPGKRGYYYFAESISTACPDGYRLPTKQEATDLVLYLNANYTGAERLSATFVPNTSRAGYHNTTSGWLGWAQDSQCWLSDGLSILLIRSEWPGDNRWGTVTLWTLYTDYKYAIPVRCIKEAD